MIEQNNKLIEHAKHDLFHVQKSSERFRRIKDKADRTVFLSAAAEIVMGAARADAIPLTVGAGFIGLAVLFRLSTIEQLRAHACMAHTLRRIIERDDDAAKPV